MGISAESQENILPGSGFLDSMLQIRVLNTSPYNLHAFFLSSLPARLHPTNYSFLFSVITETRSMAALY